MSDYTGLFVGIDAMNGAEIANILFKIMQEEVQYGGKIALCWCEGDEICFHSGTLEYSI